MIATEKMHDSSVVIAKSPTGIAGLDEITLGGLPAGRPTLVYGTPGCGKTILAMEFLVRGAREFDEPGLFVSFDEAPQQLIENFRSFDFGVEELMERKKLKISHVEFSRGEIVEAGAFSLEALLIRLRHSIAEIGAKRVVLDTLETVFSALSGNEKLRNEVARLFHWLRASGVTAIVTGERGSEGFTRHGFEDYLSDCVLLLDHRTSGQISKRRLRIIKYRGSSHATNEFPFLIGQTGLSVIPITSMDLNYVAKTERVSTGVPGVDQMLSGRGYFRASTIVIAGTSGTGKSSMAATFAFAACERGERCLYFSFEESASQIARNMKSLGMHLDPFIQNGMLTMRSFRPTFRGLEEHLVSVMQQTDLIGPAVVILDPITNFVTVGDEEEVKSMLTRVLDLLKSRGITLLMTALTTGGRYEEVESRLSSLVDTCILLDLELKSHARRRAIHIVKSRGMEHSHETRQLLMTSQGLFVDDLKADARV